MIIFCQVPEVVLMMGGVLFCQEPDVVIMIGRIYIENVLSLIAWIILDGARRKRLFYPL
jgi:hypothetical protein